MRFQRTALTGLLALSLLTARHARAVDDHMYPPARCGEGRPSTSTGAGSSSTADRTYVASGSIHYPRVPHELWHDRLQRLQRASFNCVQTYAFWNYHEPRENEFNFTGDGDLGAFLSDGATARPLRHGPPGTLRVRGVGFRRLSDLAAVQTEDARAHRRSELPHAITITGTTRFCPSSRQHQIQSRRQCHHGAVGE